MNQDILNQLRDKYKRAAEKYGEKIFSLKELEGRITHLMTTRGNFQTFIAAEMEFFEKAMSIVKTKEEELKRKTEAGARIDAILEKNLEKIKKYRDSFFDPAASIEVRKMVGAVSDWYTMAFPLIKYLFRGGDAWPEIMVIEGEIERLYIPGGRPITAFLKNYVDDLKKMGAGEKGNIERRLLQTCANTLYKMESVIKREMDKMTAFQRARAVTMTPAFDPEVREKWGKLKEFEALTEALSGISAVIDDFRLRDLAALGFKAADNAK